MCLCTQVKKIKSDKEIIARLDPLFQFSTDIVIVNQYGERVYSTLQSNISSQVDFNQVQQLIEVSKALTMKLENKEPDCVKICFDHVTQFFQELRHKYVLIVQCSNEIDIKLCELAISSAKKDLNQLIEQGHFPMKR